MIILALTVGILSGCRKDPENNPVENPTKYTDMKVPANFSFDNFNTIAIDINVNTSNSSGMNILQVYQDDPSNGRMVASGITYGSEHFTATIRVPLVIKELYLRHTGQNGAFETVKVTLSGSSLVYSFGNTKSAEALNNICGSGTPVTSNVSGRLTILAGQAKYVPYGTTVTIKELEVKTGGTFNICGTVTVQKLINNNTGSGEINNNGTLTFELEDVDLKGTINNNGTLNLTGNHEFKTNSDGKLVNNCTMYVIGNITTTGSGTIINNGYINVSGNDGSFKTTGNGGLRLGSSSLINVKEFELQNTCTGPASSPYAGIKTVNGKVTGGGAITGYVDICASGSFSHKPYPASVTKCVNNVPVPSCSSPKPPAITSALTAAGTAGEAITPYVITATGSAPITMNATNLPSGLTFNSADNTISGTVAQAGVYSINLSADNSVGTDNKVLVLSIGAANSKPDITSALTADGKAGSPFNYTIAATGTNTAGCLITYSASPMPDGLSLTGNVISGTPSASGVFEITMTATNCKGSDTKKLTLTVEAAGVAPVITSALTAEGTVGVEFTGYTITASGTAPVVLNATNLPKGLSYDASTNMITGTPLADGITNVTLTAVNDFGTDVQTLVITIAKGAGTPPILQPPFTATGVINKPFSPFTVSATGTDPIVYTVTDLPAGLNFNSENNTIWGTPTVEGTFYVDLTATNSIGSDRKQLVITIAGGGGGSYYTYYPNAVDYGTFVFEDLWPFYGDYDFNDLVVNFQYKITSNAQNQITDIEARFIFKAAGADLNNGFGFVLNTDPSNIESVTGYTQYGSAVTYDPKGYEAGHTGMTVIIPVDAVNTMFGRGFVNTIPGDQYIEPITKVINIKFASPQTDVGNLPWNPFIFRDQVRSHEIHMKNYPPTDFADQKLFRTGNDYTNVLTGQYYLSNSGLNWAFEIPVDFEYPIEKADILTAYTHFAAWAQGPVGPSNPYNNWYEDLPGYRNPANIWKQE